jgi:pimeloyl-ACP methyl ester carboxylesterase
MRRVFLIALTVVFLPGVCPAAQSRISVPLRDGCLSFMDLGVDLRGINDWTLVRGINSALGDGFHASVTDQRLVIGFDADKLPRDWNESCDALCRFTDVAAPEAVARQRLRFGLHLPRVVDPQRPLVVLIHGLDGDRACCDDLAKLIESDGFQTAYFGYPAERPLDESAELFARHMRLLREQFPTMRVDIVSESMGGLVARKYVEGPRYAGGVDHFIMIAPPNEGSTWTPYSFVLKLGVNAWRWRHDPEWSPAWMITEGICQAAGDLRPESKFLSELNDRPRRDGVRYTIIAGERPLQYRFAAEMLDWSGDLIGDRVGSWWGFRQIKSAAIDESQQLLSETGDDDGPVSITSTHLAGVADFSVLPADHLALYESFDGEPPAAWPVVRDRLSK